VGYTIGSSSSVEDSSTYPGLKIKAHLSMHLFIAYSDIAMPNIAVVVVQQS